MRTLLALASVALLAGSVIGCGDDTTTGTGVDMTATADMTAIPHDMTLLTCSEILKCAAACSGASQATCATTCIAEGKSASTTKFEAVFACASGACGPSDGGGTNMCTGPTDTGATCQQCIQGVITAGVTGGGACGQQVGACLSDT